MQNTSKAFKESIRNPRALGYRGYIKVYIGIINQDAQDAVNAEDSRNQFTYFSDIKKPFEGYEASKIYATGEQDFSRVDGTMYFLPEVSEDVAYNNGLVTEDLLGTIFISLGGLTGLDIKGLTINFGECFPVDFTVENDQGIHSYNGNAKSMWVTEDVFYGTSFFIIRPSKMVNGEGRLRILQFSCGISNTFSNNEVRDYTFKDYISSISETIPSQDVSLTVDNQNLYYDPDNEESALAFMEIGQEVKVSFGYDIENSGNIEWLRPNTCYLKTWKADDVKAKFTATDKFDFISGKYYKGLYRQNGISLYDLAIDVLAEAGITDNRDFFVDPYLKKVIVYNPMPVVEYTEALQIIANAGRCVLFQDRESRIHIQSSFVPDMAVEAPDKADFSQLADLLKDNEKPAYAMGSADFSVVDGSVFFMPEDTNYLPVGYVSESLADTMGNFLTQPQVTINFEAAFVCFGLCIKFRNVAPQVFKVSTYNEGILVQEFSVEEPEITYITYAQFDLFDKMVITFTRGYPNSRITVDSILIGDVTDYTLSNDYFHATPERARQKRIKAIKVKRKIYRESSEKKELSQEEISLGPENLYYTVYFNNPSYGFEIAVVENENVTCTVVESSNYYAKLRFEGITSDVVVKYIVSGYEYVIEENQYVVQHNETGDEKEWSNPLISTIEHAKDLEEWLSTFLLGNVDYKINWWGDPCVDANDLFYLETKDKPTFMIRTYENTLKFSSAGWSGSVKARKVMLHD